jgi:hypothetical protein
MQSYTTAQANTINAVNGIRYIKWQFVIGTKSASTAGFTPKANAGAGDITPFVSQATIAHDTQQPVHRSCSLQMAETAASQTLSTTNGGTMADAGIDYLNDQLQVTCLISPDNATWYSWPVGTFFFRQAGVTMAGHSVVRKAELVDFTHLVQQQQSIANDAGVALILPAGYYIIDVVKSLLTNSPTLTQPSDPTLLTLSNLPGCGIPTPWISSSWPTSATKNAVIPTGGYPVSEGDDYLTLINRLLSYIHCYDLWCDETGQFQVTSWPANQDYTTLSSTWAYDSTANSIISVGGTEDFMVDDLANSVSVIVEDVNRTPLYATATNTNAASPISTVNWGASFYGTGTPRVVSKVVRDTGIPDNTTTSWVQGYANQQLNMACWLVDQVTLPTAVNPLHQDHDVIALNIYQTAVAGGSVNSWPIVVGTSTPATSTPQPIPGLVVTQKFLELGWTIDIELPSPGSGQNITGGVGMTTMLEPRDQKQGHQMTHTLHRVTSLR